MVLLDLSIGFLMENIDDEDTLTPESELSLEAFKEIQKGLMEAQSHQLQSIDLYNLE